jgi:hypothetical protein
MSHRGEPRRLFPFVLRELTCPLLSLAGLPQMGLFRSSTPEQQKRKEDVMEKIKELFIVVENRPGTLGELLGLLAKEKINIEAIGLFQDVAKISVSDLGRAKKSLLARKYEVETREVLRLELDNKPGTFAFVTSRLATAGLNIDYCYGTVAKGQKNAAVIIDVPDLDRAMAVLEGAER